MCMEACGKRKAVPFETGCTRRLVEHWLNKLEQWELHQDSGRGADWKGGRELEHKVRERQREMGRGKVVGGREQIIWQYQASAGAGDAGSMSMSGSVMMRFGHTDYELLHDFDPGLVACRG